jgi:hypothetical protein
MQTTMSVMVLTQMPILVCGGNPLSNKTLETAIDLLTSSV